MRGFIPSYEVIAPTTLNEALNRLKTQPGVWKPLAGGTDLMVQLEMGTLEHRRFINLSHYSELKGIHEIQSQLHLGALTTHTEIRNHPLVQKYFPLFAEAARSVGACAIQNRGTLGGNIANASPAADTPPALLVYDASLELCNIQGSRWVPYSSFHTGYKKTLLKQDEIIRSIALPLPPAHSKLKAHFTFKKIGTRKAQSISKVCMAALAETDAGEIKKIRIAYGSLAPIPIRCLQTEALLLRRKAHAETYRLARETLTREINPIDDIRSTAAYRKEVAMNLLEDFLKTL